MQHRRQSFRPVTALLLTACAITPIRAAEPPAADRATLLAAAKTPAPVELPRPQSPVVLPDEARGPNATISIRLAHAPPPGVFTARRVSTGDGRLYLGIRSAGGDLTGAADVTCASHQLHTDIAGGELWLALIPRIGHITLHVSSAGNPDGVDLIVPTTLVETRGRQIFLNNELFLLKGAMSRNLTGKDAAYVHSLGINTLRGFEALADCERYGFMGIVSFGFGDTATKASVNQAPADFDAKTLPAASAWLLENAKAAIASPNALILQLGNEKTPGSNKPPGTEPLRPNRRNAAHLLVTAYNTVKPLAPMLPVGYANQDLGFLAADCMDVYMHNSFLTRDRYNYDWDDFLRWQGCFPPDGPTHQGRPFVNSEFGANRYLPQSYHNGPNNPFLEKLHAWNFPNRWKEFMDHGTAGGSIYCLYDLPEPKDQGCSRFGILTVDGTPKLACWDVAHMWRDFDLDVRDNQLTLSFKRDYHARACRLTLTTPDGKTTTHPLDDFAPRTTRTMPLADLGLNDSSEFRWQLDFSTHSGLPNRAAGAHPLRAEQRDFLDLLKSRDTYPFLRELFDAQVMTADAKPAPPTLAEMTRPDGLTPVALRKPNGVTYLLLISREKPTPSAIKDHLELDVAFKGHVTLVDDMTGQPLPAPVDATPTSAGLHLTNLQAARIPGAIGARSDAPFKLPIYRISP